MKTLYIEAQKKTQADIGNIDFKNLPSKIFLTYSIQYKPLALTIKKKLGKRVIGFQQVLGCSLVKSKVPILLISSGRFHALNLLLRGNIVYILENNTIKKIDNEEIEKYKKQRKTAKLKFLSADKVGILVSCKPGQEQLDKALELKRRLEKQGKSAFIFIADTINLDELENYPIDSWVNTACPSLIFDSDSRILNIQDID